MKKIFSFAAAMIAAMSMSAQDPIPATCAEAAAAMPAQNGSETEEVYIVTGYITNTNGSISKGQQTFYMDDAKGSKKTLQGYWCNLPAEEVEANKPLNVGDKITLTGKIMNYNNTAEIKNGDVAILERAANYIDTIDISVCKAIEIGSALNDLDYSADAYRVYGRLIGQDQVNSTYGLHTFDMACGEQIFKAYNCKGVEGLELGKGDSVVVIGKLYNYRGTIEISNGTVELIEENPEETFDTISVARALEIGLALADNGVTPVEYVIEGYVSSIEEYYDEQYGNETFWITDSLGSRASGTANGAFEIYRGKPNTEKEIGLDAKIKIVCKIKNYKGTIENDGTGIVFEVLEQGQDLVFDTITVARAIEIGMALEDNATTDVDYVVNGYVVKAYEPDSGYTNQNFYMADFLDEYGEFYAYRCTPDKQVVAGDFLYVLGKIQKYVKNDKVTIELSYGTATHGDVPAIDTIRIDVKKAVEIGMELAKETKTAEYYLVTGYVANITSEFDEEEKNESFWMNDEEDAVEGKFFANLARIAEPGAGLHQKVTIFGRIQHYVDEEGESIIRIDKGSAKLINDEGIENVVLTEQATKVLVDGVLYIIRDNKMYNIQGARVR